MIMQVTDKMITDDVIYSFREAMTNIVGSRIADLFGADEIEELLNATLIVMPVDETETGLEIVKD